MASWAPLTAFLEASTEERVVLTLDEIGEILGRPVPASAIRHRAVFWGNSNGNSYSRIWRSAGYRTALRGLPADQVAFVRSDAPDAAAEPPRIAPDATVVLVGCVKT